MSILDSNNQSGGDKRTLLAVVLSVVVITVGILLQPLLFPSAAAPLQGSAGTTPTAVSPGTENTAAPPEATVVGQATTGMAGSKASAAPTDAPIQERKYTLSTDLLEATFTNRGGDLVSLRLKKHGDKGGLVNLVVPNAAGLGGLALSFGEPGTAPLADLMGALLLDSRTIVFSRTYLASVAGKSAPVPFTLKKTYTFRDGEYMFALSVGLENSINDYIPLDASGIAYTLSFGPQIGPKLTSKPGGNEDYRKFVQYVGGKKKDERPKAGSSLVLKDQPSWVAISGKYFSFIVVPELGAFTTTLTTNQDPLLFQTDTMAISRPSIKTSKQADSYYFYFGPKTTGELSKYNFQNDNGFKRNGLNLDQAADTSGILAPLETGIKFLLTFFHNIIPNYGLAIILVTILVKALLFPLTKNGSVASAKMQELQPKMKELQAKYKGNPQKLNQEMAEFYKKEGYNPMSGCLPLLIQFPIFIAMYNLFNNHFDLRGAMFIPGWIPDLSQPEAIFRFSEINFLLVQISALRALPIIYLVSQLLYGKYTQTTAAGQSGMQMKLMMYGMPIMFFFILYNTPSGLLVYWIISNLLSIGQQIVINDLLKKRKHALAASAPAIPAFTGKKPSTKGKKK